jgi:predicted phosphodiesterase
MQAEEPFDADYMDRKDRISKSLDEELEKARGGAAGTSTRSFDLMEGCYIIFSDLHRGIRNHADDFARNERAYNAALAYYFRMGYTLVVLGDVEELWEERPVPVLDAYQHSIGLEAKFHREGRYLRVRGNHDDEWQYEARVKKLLAPLYGGDPLKVYSSLLIEVKDNTGQLGVLFLVHGHQGSTTSDRWPAFSKFVVRYLWRPIQRLTHLSLNTPAKSWRLRQGHNRALYDWAAQQDEQLRLVLIAGHTHRPVFESQTHVQQLHRELAELDKIDDPTTEQKDERAETAAEIEWVLAQNMQAPGEETQADSVKPCYFNTGCCCFLDGDITGLELADGQIRLVRWPDDDKEPKRHIFPGAQCSLEDVLAAC